MKHLVPQIAAIIIMTALLFFYAFRQIIAVTMTKIAGINPGTIYSTTHHLCPSEDDLFKTLTGLPSKNL